MPGLARKVEKLWKNSAKPATSSPMRAITTSAAGRGPNSCSRSCSSVAVHFVEQALELGQLADQLQDDGRVGRRRRLDPDRHDALPEARSASAGIIACIVKSIDILLRRHVKRLCSCGSKNIER